MAVEGGRASGWLCPTPGGSFPIRSSRTQRWAGIINGFHHRGAWGPEGSDVPSPRGPLGCILHAGAQSAWAKQAITEPSASRKKPAPLRSREASFPPVSVSSATPWMVACPWLAFRAHGG